MNDDDKMQLFGKIDKISSDIVDIKVTLGKQEENINHHIKRSDLLETQVDLLKNEVAKSKGAKDFLVFAAKIGSFLVAIIAATVTIIKRLS